MAKHMHNSRFFFLSAILLMAGMLLAGGPAFAQNDTVPAGNSPAFGDEANDSGLDWVRVISDSAMLLKSPSSRSEAVRKPNLYDIYLVVDRVKSFFLVRDEETKSFLFIDQYAVEFTDYAPPKANKVYLRNEKMILGMDSPHVQLFGKRYSGKWTGDFIQPVSGHIGSGFGMRNHPIQQVYKMHSGVDIGAPYGTPIHAGGDGLVVLASWNGGYGKAVMIDHGGGVMTLYGHCSSFAVSVGDIVRAGQTIAYVGSTGLSTGPHVHFEVRVDGKPVDPMSRL
jgi:murein DD-endopeptidase MepM/ murein hydrolase activator NlpD